MLLRLHFVLLAFAPLVVYALRVSEDTIAEEGHDKDDEVEAEVEVAEMGEAEEEQESEEEAETFEEEEETKAEEWQEFGSPAIRKHQMHTKADMHINATNPTTPTPLNPSNRGRCYPGRSLHRDTRGYTWWIGDQQRCTSVHIPRAAPRPMPVMLGMSCYTRDRVPATAWRRFPVANFVLSTSFATSSGSGGWRTGNDGAVTEQNPQPCSSDDTPEMLYVQAIFDLIEADSATYNANRIYTYGFSQNSMFSAYVGFCFSHKVAGIAQTGSGLVVAAEGHDVPNKGGQCKYSDFIRLGRRCVDQTPCGAECEYWPIYPCYEPRPVVHCGFTYARDRFAPTQRAMFNRTVIEGFDSRYIEFPGGRHSTMRNKEEWYAGCLGLTEPCSATCVAAFETCVRGADYRRCLHHRFFPPSCRPDCSPTLEMLRLSENPSVEILSQGDFGSSSHKKARGTSSMCSHNSGR